MGITITIDTENEAFGPDEVDAALEVGRILRRLAERLEASGMIRIGLPDLTDINGNRVGTYQIEEAGND